MCYILFMENRDSDGEPIPAWVQQIRMRGLGDACLAALDALEPVGALGAQALLVAQPMLGAFGWREAAGGLAAALETPDGMAQLRRWLEDDVDDDEGGG
jgi:hypothetical protein